MGILLVQTMGMIIHRLNTLVEALHEVSEMEDVRMKPMNVKSHKAILDEGRLLLFGGRIYIIIHLFSTPNARYRFL